MANTTLNLQQETVNFLLLPVDQAATIFRSIVREEIRTKQEQDLQEKLLSPAEVCTLFKPKISIATLNNWANQGLIQKHYLGKLTFYKYSEVINSLQTLKKYQRPKPFTSQ